MKKLLPIILLLGFALAIFFFFRARGAKNIANNEATPSASSTISSPATSTFALYKEEGEVMYKIEKGKYEMLTQDEKSLKTGSWVKTGKNGLAHVELSSGHLISLAENSEMQIESTESKTSITQEAGKTWHRIKKLLGQEEYQVETASSVAAVRGTTFGVEVDEQDRDKAEIYATDGELKVGQKTVVQGKKVFQNWQALKAGRLAQIVSAARQRRIAVSQIPEARKKMLWFKRNQIIDQEFKQNLRLKILERIKKNQELLKLRQQNLFNQLPLRSTDLVGYCQIVKGAEFQKSYRAMRENQASLPPQYQGYVEFYRVIDECCNDGDLNEEELRQIKAIADKLSGNQAAGTSGSAAPGAPPPTLNVVSPTSVAPPPTATPTPANINLKEGETIELYRVLVSPTPIPTPTKYYLR